MSDFGYCSVTDPSSPNFDVLRWIKQVVEENQVNLEEVDQSAKKAELINLVLGEVDKLLEDHRRSEEEKREEKRINLAAALILAWKQATEENSENDLCH